MFGGSRESPESSTTTYRLWWEGPERFREEIGADARHVLVRDGERWWTGSRDWGVVSSETDRGGPQQGALGHLVEPGRLLAVFRLHPKGTGSVAGRRTLGATGAPRPGDDGALMVVHRVGAGADGVELDVDAERGTLLRLTALLDGEPFHSFEVTELAFDEAFPPETFVYAPEPGEDPPERWRPERLRLDEAAQRAPFTLLAPARVPEGWRLHVTWMEPRDRPRVAASAHLSYESADGAYTVQIRQQATDEPHEEWLAFARRGDVEVADAGEDVQPRHYVRAERNETFVELSGDDLELLLTLAAELVPAPTEPPRLP
jgi:outer membrane lipoprotein-sorting protein